MCLWLFLFIPFNIHFCPCSDAIFFVFSTITKYMVVIWRHKTREKKNRELFVPLLSLPTAAAATATVTTTAPKRTVCIYRKMHKCISLQCWLLVDWRLAGWLAACLTAIAHCGDIVILPRFHRKICCSSNQCASCTKIVRFVGLFQFFFHFSCEITALHCTYDGTFNTHTKMYTKCLFVDGIHISHLIHMHRYYYKCQVASVQTFCMQFYSIEREKTFYYISPALAIASIPDFPSASMS